MYPAYLKKNYLRYKNLGGSGPVKDYTLNDVDIMKSKEIVQFRPLYLNEDSEDFLKLYNSQTWDCVKGRCTKTFQRGKYTNFFDCHKECNQKNLHSVFVELVNQVAGISRLSEYRENEYNYLDGLGSDLKDSQKYWDFGGFLQFLKLLDFGFTQEAAVYTTEFVRQSRHLANLLNVVFPSTIPVGVVSDVGNWSGFTEPFHLEPLNRYLRDHLKVTWDPQYINSETVENYERGEQTEPLVGLLSTGGEQPHALAYGLDLRGVEKVYA